VTNIPRGHLFAIPLMNIKLLFERRETPDSFENYQRFISYLYSSQSQSVETVTLITTRNRDRDTIVVKMNNFEAKYRFVCKPFLVEMKCNNFRCYFQEL
jgi:hypothetical protein